MTKNDAKILLYIEKCLGHIENLREIIKESNKLEVIE